MRRNSGKRLRIVEIAFIFLRFNIILRSPCRLRHNPAGSENGPDSLPHFCRFTQPLRDDVTGSSQRDIQVRNLIIDILGRFVMKITHVHFIHLVSQRFQPGLLSHGSASSTLRTIRQIQVLQLVRIDARLNRLPQLRRQLVLRIDCREYRLLAFLHISEHISPMPDPCNLLIIKASRTLLTIAADKRNGTALLKKSRAILHLPILYLKRFRDIFYVYRFHIFNFCQSKFRSRSEIIPYS